jgi:uncharacterized membrane protein YtjA (UPF0391 family)
MRGSIGTCSPQERPVIKIATYSFGGIGTPASFAYDPPCTNHWRIVMLNWAITFLVVALIAAVFGFTGVAVAAAGIAKLLFIVFLVLFVVSLATHLGRRGSRV